MRRYSPFIHGWSCSDTLNSSTADHPPVLSTHPRLFMRRYSPRIHDWSLSDTLHSSTTDHAPIFSTHPRLITLRYSPRFKIFIIADVLQAAIDWLLFNVKWVVFNYIHDDSTSMQTIHHIGKTWCCNGPMGEWLSQGNLWQRYINHVPDYR